MESTFWLFQIGPIAVLGFALSAYVVALTLGDVYLVAVHLLRGRKELEREGSARSRAPAGGAQLPLVCIQLPVHNEPPAMVIETLESLAALDYPDYEVVVIDNNTSDRAVWQPVQERCLCLGARFRFFHFDAMQDFKAGALREGLLRTNARYIAVFDVDYRPAASFLRETMNVLLAEPRAAFVQARLDTFNRQSNWLTRAQALEFDTYHAYEQAARHWAGVPTTFKGSCAVWRRDAIEQACGWSARSLVEDQDLSFRVFEMGWKARNLISVSVAGELPESFTVLMNQRHRWGAGAAQAFRDLPWRLLRHLRWHQALAFVTLQQFYVVVPICLVANAAVVAASLYWELDRAHALSIWFLAAVASIVVTKSIGAALATRLLGRTLGLPFFCDLGRMWLVQLCLLPIVGRSLVAGFVSRRIRFVRTPKKPRGVAS